MTGECTVDVRLFGFIRGAIEIVIDLAIISLPLPMLARLQMSMKKKLQVMSMFCVGFIITVVSCLRLWALVQFDQSSNPTCTSPWELNLEATNARSQMTTSRVFTGA
jgi:hypothetical protein